MRSIHVIVSMGDPTVVSRLKSGAAAADSAIYLNKVALAESAIDLIKVDDDTCVCVGAIPAKLVAHLRRHGNRIIRVDDPKSAVASGGFACGQDLSTASFVARPPRRSDMCHHDSQRNHSPPAAAPDSRGKKKPKRSDEAKARREQKQNEVRSSQHPNKWDSCPEYRIKMSFLGATRENFRPNAVPSWIAVEATTVPPSSDNMSDEADDTAYEAAD